MSLDEAFIRRIVRHSCDDLKNEKFVPILESDVIAYLYHLMVSEGVPAASIHVDSRVIGLGNEKVDLAIGEVVWRRDGKRAVKPHLIMEVKAFFRDFSGQQCRRRFMRLIGEASGKKGDLEKLREIECDYKYVLILDEKGYLRGTYKGEKRESVISKRKDKIAPGVRIMVITPDYEVREF